MNILIVDDEKPCRMVIHNYLRQMSEVKLIHEADNVDKALHLISSAHPDLIFLDIKLRHETGFDLLDKVTQRNFQVVFTTAFDDYAIKAFEYAAIHYLLKPIDRSEIRKVIKRCKSGDFELDNEKVKEAHFLYLKTEDKTFNIDLSTVTHFEAEGSYCRIHFLSGKSVFSARNIGTFEKELPSHFFRIHRSTIVNLKMVAEIKSTIHAVVLKNQIEVSVSRRKRSAFKEALKKV